MTESDTSFWFSNYFQEQNALEKEMLDLKEEKEKMTLKLSSYKHLGPSDNEFNVMVSEGRDLDGRIESALTRQEQLEMKLVIKLKTDP